MTQITRYLVPQGHSVLADLQRPDYFNGKLGIDAGDIVDAMVIYDPPIQVGDTTVDRSSTLLRVFRTGNGGTVARIYASASPF